MLFYFCSQHGVLILLFRSLWPNCAAICSLAFVDHNRTVNYFKLYTQFDLCSCIAIVSHLCVVVLPLDVFVLMFAECCFGYLCYVVCFFLNEIITEVWFSVWSRAPRLDCRLATCASVAASFAAGLTNKQADTILLRVT